MAVSIGSVARVEVVAVDHARPQDFLSSGIRHDAIADAEIPDAPDLSQGVFRQLRICRNEIFNLLIKRSTRQAG